ncbi:50S ribosomal protein L28 [Brachybacterium paraconglomeratum]|uniref:50S ribosomal protein L28 n=1 Tax=Brachybacterium paraconglomeratum TaxID=173362 RepID=UPI003879F46D
MSQRCQVIGAVPRFGKSVSPSHRRTSRRFDPDVQTKRYFVPSLGRTVRLRVSTRGMRTIDHRGIEAVVAEIHARREKI